MDPSPRFRRARGSSPRLGRSQVLAPTLLVLAAVVGLCAWFVLRTPPPRPASDSDAGGGTLRAPLTPIAAAGARAGMDDGSTTTRPASRPALASSAPISQGALEVELRDPGGVACSPGTVELHREEGLPLRGDVDERGKVRFELLTAGRYRVEVVAESLASGWMEAWQPALAAGSTLAGFREITAQVVAGQTSRCTLHVLRPASLSGTPAGRGRLAR